MKSRKSVFRFENTPMNNFFSVTHYSPKDKRMYKGQRTPYELVCYEEGMFVQCQILMYGLWDVEVQIDDATWDVLDSDHRRLYLTKTRSIVDEVRK